MQYQDRDLQTPVIDIIHPHVNNLAPNNALVDPL